MVNAAKLPDLFVTGNKLTWIVNNQFFQVQLKGVDSTSALYMCLFNESIFDGPANTPSYMAAMKNWTADIVRIPVNQDCWLGASYISPSTSGAAYQQALSAYITALVNYGFYVILDLAWTRGGSAKANQEQPMPDLSTITFWTSAANAFKGTPGHVIFDLFNEPFPDQNAIDNPTAWGCWQNGGTSCPHLNYTAVGFQALVDTVRSTGALNIIMIGGINYANDLDQWLSYKPADPYDRVIASWHSYNFNFCNNAVCWELSIAPTMEAIPVIAGEIGENDCGGGYITPLMAWLDSKVTSYLAWTFMPFNCEQGPALVSDNVGTCTQSYGCTYYAHLKSTALNRTRSLAKKDGRD